MDAAVHLANRGRHFCQRCGARRGAFGERHMVGHLDHITMSMTHREAERRHHARWSCATCSGRPIAASV
jgi:hypothetical protein